MKCPNCSKWNRASLPVCQGCGTPLEPDQQAEPSWRGTLRDGNKPKAYIRMDMDGNPQTDPDSRDVLAREMNELKVRKAAGREYQRQLRTEAADRGSAPSSATVRSRVDHERFWQVADDPRTTLHGTSETKAQPGQPMDPAAGAGSEKDINFNPLWSEEEFSATFALPPLQPTGKFTARIPSRRRGLHRFAGFLTVLLIIGLVALAGYFGFRYYQLSSAANREKTAATVEATMKNEQAAHTIYIPGEDGQQIYIRELHSSYFVTGGFATIEVEDHVWYDDYEDYLDETMEVTLTPFLKTASGQQKPLPTISYEISIPLSPMELLSPDAPREEVSASMYTMKFQVRPGSKVTINGKDYSDTVDSEDGTLSYNATVQPIGDNVFTVVVRSQYCRENTMQVVLFRQTQEVPLDLAADTYTSTSSQRMLVSCTTTPGADVQVLSPHTDLDITNIDSSGAFTFYAVFDHIGYNTISITASVPGKKTS